jgi:hypothetical protein
MAKHFGMNLQYRSLSGTYETLVLDELLQIVHHSLSGNTYIHPDSLHLLEPKEDDIGFDGSNYGSVYKLGRIFYVAVLFSEHNGEKVERIIQRNGIAFMWPQCEERVAA